MTSTLRPTYYGFVPKGRRYAEVAVVKVRGERSSQSETGVTYATFDEAERAVGSKNARLR